MSIDNQIKNQHLFWRAGFGPAVEQLQDLTKFNPRQFYDALIQGSKKEHKKIEVSSTFMDDVRSYMDGDMAMDPQKLSADKRKLITQALRDGVRQINLAWMQEMVNSRAQLKEKLAFFWHGHFACRIPNVFFIQDLLDIFRRNALGNFGTMLHEVSKSGAMLNFLNNQQNRKGHPNENFAREVMELFTLGIGNYTENDIKEAARAFTGWGSNRQGTFTFRKFFHDDGSKTVLGTTGNLTGEDVLNILLKQKRTAYYITKKLYSFFVHDQVDEKRVEWLANRFYENNYEIAPLLKDIFTADWFYDEKNIGSRIKSPIELLVGIQRIMPLQLNNYDAMLSFQRLLGQIMLAPPSVAGWAGGRSWIDSSSLMLRMRLPKLLIGKDVMNNNPKSDDDFMMGQEDMRQRIMQRMVTKGLDANVNWDSYIKSFSVIPKEKLYDQLQKTLLQYATSNIKSIVDNVADSSSREAYIKSTTVQLMTLPDYQLC